MTFRYAEHETHGHSTKCLREASEMMDRNFVSSDGFIADAIRYLTQFGSLKIDEDNNAWTVTVDPDKLPEPIPGIVSCGTLLEALCGAVHSVPVMLEA